MKDVSIAGGTEDEQMTHERQGLKPLTTSLLCGCALLAMSAHAHPGAHTAAAMKAMAAHDGIWKAAVPPVKMNGAFDDHDPIGLVAGKLIPADCSLNWTDPDTHKLYCFSSATSLVYFLDAPQTYLAEAEKNWLALTARRVR